MMRSTMSVWMLAMAGLIAGSGVVFAQPAGYPRVFDVAVTGKGHPVILVPGLATSGEVWDATVAALEDRYQLHVVTLAGFGGPPPLGEPFLPRVVDALVEYVERKELVSPVLVGHSLGGFVAFAAASQEPDAFGGVVAVDGVPYLPALTSPEATPAGQAERASSVRTMYDSLTREQFVAQTEWALSSMISAPADVKRASAWAAGADPRAVGIAVAEMLTTDGRTATERIATPVLLMAALGAAPEPMRETFRQSYRAQVARVPDVTVVFAEQARHFIMLDDPAFFIRTLERFLDRVVNATGKVG